MDFLKKHYEKLILGLVLVGLAGAAGYLPIKVNADRQAAEQERTTLTQPKVKELTNLDLSLPDSALKRVAAATALDFSSPNKVFNPMPWQKAADGQIIPGTKVGPSAAVVTNLNALYLRLTLDSVSVTDGGCRYVIGVQKEAAANAAQRAKKQTYASLNTKSDVFTLVEVKGKAEDPTQVVLELNDTGERVSISKEKGFSRADGYTADLRYEPEKKVWTGKRVGAAVSFNGEEYNIVAINQNEIVLSAKSNQKKWTIKANPNAGS